MVAGLALSASPIALAGARNAYAQAKQTTPEKSLYERLGGVFAIAAVVDHFSDAASSPERPPHLHPERRSHFAKEWEGLRSVDARRLATQWARESVPNHNLDRSGKFDS
jgi:hypothetical protein